MSPPDASSWNVRVNQAQEHPKVDPVLLPKKQKGKTREPPVVGPVGAYVWRIPRWDTGVFNILEGKMGEVRWRGEGLLGDPSSCSATPGP